MVIDFVIVPLLCVVVEAAGYAFIIFDRLVRSEYEHHPGQWMSDGEPRGIFWRPEGCVHRRNWRALRRVSWLWLFRTPAWVAESPESMKTLTRYRVSNCVLFGVFLIFLAVLSLILFAPNKITGANAGGSPQLPARVQMTARIAQFSR
jgi:hypothetical protein